MPDDSAVNRTTQARIRNVAFAARLEAALGSRDKAWLARETGLSTSTIGDYAKGSIPGADRAFAMADVLGVSARWLVTGEEEHGPALGVEWALLPFYDPYSLKTDGKPDAQYEIPVLRDWLARATRTSGGWWLTEMPADLRGAGARFGDIIVCQDPPGRITDGGLYLFQLGEGLAVRRAVLWPESRERSSRTTPAEHPDEEQLHIFAEDASALSVLGIVRALYLKGV